MKRHKKVLIFSGKDIAKKVSDKTGTNVIVTKGADGFIAYLRKDNEYKKLYIILKMIKMKLFCR